MFTQGKSLQKETLLPKGRDRLDYLDGIRGIASIFVVFCHIVCVFLPQFYYYDKADSAISQFWLNTPLNIITNGRFSVQWFFTLSGFLIARKIYTKREQAITSPFKTYRKLLGIVAPAVIFSAALMVLGGMYHFKALELSPELEFVVDYNNFPVRFTDVLWNIFVKPFIKSSDFVGPFWTIRYEMLGSVLVAAVSWYAYSNPKYSKWIYLVLSVYLTTVFSAHLVAFMMGALAYDCIYRLDTDKSILGRLINKCLTNKPLCVLALLIGTYFATINLSLSGIWAPLAKLPIGSGLFRVGGITITLVCICRMKGLQRLLSVRLFRWLGSVSAFTYAFHWPIILSWGCGLFVLLYGKVDYAVLVALITVSVLLLSIVMAYGYMKLSATVKKGMIEKIKGLKEKNEEQP